jgi:hypothetical protein
VRGRGSSLAGFIGVLILALAATGSATTSVQHELGINNFIVGKTRASSKRAYSYLELKQLRFALGIDLISEHSAFPETSEAVQIVLPAGLSWGDEPAWPRTLWSSGTPGPWSFETTGQSCEVAGQVATCRADGVPAATTLFGWIFDAVAAKPGIYKITGEVVPPTDGQNRAPRGADTPVKAVLTLVVGPRTGAVKAGGVVLTRPRPSFVRASVEVTQADVGVRPSSASCNGSFLGDASYQKRYAPVLALRGSVTCTFVFNNAKYVGKTLAGELAFTVARTKVRRKFSVRIGPGTTLSSPKGATLKQRR